MLDQGNTTEREQGRGKGKKEQHVLQRKEASGKESMTMYGLRGRSRGKA